MSDKRKNPMMGGKQGQEGYTKPDPTVRCKTPSCGHGRDETGALMKPPLVAVDVRLVNPDGPNPVIAQVTRCEYCGILYDLKIFDQACEKFGFRTSALVGCLKQTRMTTFHLHELQEGKIDDVAVPVEAPRAVARVEVLNNPEGFPSHFMYAQGELL